MKKLKVPKQFLNRLLNLENQVKKDPVTSKKIFSTALLKQKSSSLKNKNKLITRGCS